MAVRWIGGIVAGIALGGMTFGAHGAGRAAGPVTFAEDVAPIFYKHCVECHRPGEVAPMSLRTYEEARPWAKSIKQKVAAREMPPWFADPEYGTFKNDPRLSEDAIATIVRWVDTGARRGDPSAKPPAPEFSDGWRLGEPDHVLELPEVDVPATGSDYFPDLSVEVDLPESRDRWVSAVEIRPSNREVAHHVVVFSADPGGMDVSRRFGILAVWAAGTPPTEFPDGMGRWVRDGQRLMTNMHYHPNGTPQTDRTRIGLHFGKGELEQEIHAALNGSWQFTIPAHASNHKLTTSWTIHDDIEVVSFFPHMHLRGKSMKFTANYPDGRSEVLLNVPQWDFDWQLFYYPEEFVYLPEGTRIDVVAHYDNSAANPANPDPARDVGFGLESTDEMMFGVFEYVTADGNAPRKVSDEERIDALAASMPADELYVVPIKFRGNRVTSALHLPRAGDGAWHVPFGGQLIALPIDTIEWDGDAFSFHLEVKFGGGGMRMEANGRVTPDGEITGTFSGGGGLLPITDFQGQAVQSSAS